MRIAPVAALLAVAVTVAFIASDAQVLFSEPCTVERVVDGDTIVCEDGTRVRLLLIDASERDQTPYGSLATLELERLLPISKTVRLELDVQHHDRYGDRKSVV